MLAIIGYQLDTRGENTELILPALEAYDSGIDNAAEAEGVSLNQYMLYKLSSTPRHGNRQYHQ